MRGPNKKSLKLKNCNTCMLHVCLLLFFLFLVAKFSRHCFTGKILVAENEWLKVSSKIPARVGWGEGVLNVQFLSGGYCDAACTNCNRIFQVHLTRILFVLELSEMSCNGSFCDRYKK